MWSTHFQHPRDGHRNWVTAMAASVLSSLLPLVMFLLLQESFLCGFALTRDK